jgi:hypothetical protein
MPASDGKPGPPATETAKTGASIEGGKPGAFIEAQKADAPAETEIAEQWGLVNTPLGESWSGRTRYAAAMFFHQRGDMNADTLEVYRLCSRLDSEDPLSIIRQRGVGKAWLERMIGGV